MFWSQTLLCSLRKISNSTEICKNKELRQAEIDSLIRSNQEKMKLIDLLISS